MRAYKELPFVGKYESLCIFEWTLVRIDHFYHQIRVFYP